MGITLPCATRLDLVTLYSSCPYEILTYYSLVVVAWRLPYLVTLYCLVCPYEIMYSPSVVAWRLPNLVTMYCLCPYEITYSLYGVACQL